MTKSNLIAAVLGAGDGKKKRLPIKNDDGDIIGYQMMERVYDSPQPNRDIYRPISRKNKGMSAAGLGGTSGGGKSKRGKGPNTKSKKGDNCFKGGKECED